MIRFFRAIKIIFWPVWVVEQIPGSSHVNIAGQWVLKMRQRKLSFTEKLGLLIKPQKWEPFYKKPFDTDSKFNGFSVGGFAHVSNKDYKKGKIENYDD